MINCFPLPASFLSLSRACCIQFSTFPQLWVNKYIQSQLPSRLPAKQPLLDRLPPCPPPISLNHRLLVYLLSSVSTASKCLFDLARLSCRSSHHDGLHNSSIRVSKCISKLHRSQPPIVSENSLDYGVQVSTMMAFNLSASRHWSAAPCSLDHRVVMRLSYISKLHYSHWKPPGVSERMWSVNLDASISGEY
jgi:hypothetical protein